MLHAPCNQRIAVYTPAQKLAPAGFCAFCTRPPAGLNATRSVQQANCSLHPLSKNLPLLGFVPASGLTHSAFTCYKLRATSELQFTPLPKSLLLLGFVPASGLTHQWGLHATRSVQQANCSLHPYVR